VAQGEGAVLIDQAMVDAAKLNMDYARIVSPIDGVTGIRTVDPGNIVRANDANGIVVVTQLDPIAVIFTLPQDALLQISEMQQREPLEVVVFSRDGSSELGRGKLAVIDNAIVASTASLRLKAVLPNPERALWPNQFVKARLMLTERKGAIVIPAHAIQRGPEGPFVYVVGSDKTAQPRPVVPDLLQGELAIVAQGLQPGDVVVTEGQNQLRPGGKVSWRAAGDKAGSEPGKRGPRSAAGSRGPDAGSAE
jgi:multidrug efflux system membrane fusion protein